jgi:ubiquinone biosynthesis protein
MVSIVSAVRDLGRLREITSVLVRHGFGEIVTRIGLGQIRKGRGQASSTGASSSEEESDAMTPEELERGEAERKTISIYERARLVLQDLGPSFIKLGQVASTRPDLLPPELIRELKKASG